MPDEGDPIRQQLTEARRNQILEAAVAVFASKGFSRATTREIAEVAGVSEGTIYNYFESKADLLAFLVMRLARLQELSESLAQALLEDPAAFFVRIAGNRLGMIAQDQRLFQVVLSELLVNDELRQRFYGLLLQETIAPLERYVSARVDRGDFRPLDVALTVRAVQSMFLGFVFLRVLGDNHLIQHWDRLPGVISDLVFHGMAADKAGPTAPAGASSE